MGSKTAEEFFTEFESLLSITGYKKMEKHVKVMVERHANTAIVDSIYETGAIPSTYEE